MHNSTEGPHLDLHESGSRVNLPWELAADDEGIRQQVTGLLGTNRDALVNRIVQHSHDYGTSGRLTVKEALQGLQRAQMAAAAARVGLKDQQVQQNIKAATEDWVKRNQQLFG
jgi:hypothetical protein